MPVTMTSGFPLFFSSCQKAQQELVRVLDRRFDLFGANNHSAGLGSVKSLLFDRAETAHPSSGQSSRNAWKDR